MNFSKKLEKLEKEVSIFRLEIEGGEEIPSGDMVRIMLQGGQIFEPCKILGETDDFIDFIVFDLDIGPIFSISINKEEIIAFGTFNKPLEDLHNIEEELNTVPSALYL